MAAVLILALAGTAIVAVAAVRPPLPTPRPRGAWLVVGAGWGVRLVGALVVMWLVALTRDGNAVWLNDEEAFHRATAGLLPNPWDQQLPVGLQHFAGSAYLGLTTALYLIFGPDASLLRIANAILGALVAVASMRIAGQLFGSRSSRFAGLLVALWPPLVFFSILILRDTLVSLSIVACWWGTVAWATGQRLKAAGVAFLALVIAAELRPYVAALLAIALACWAAYPLLRRMGWPLLAGLATCAALAVAAVLVLRPAALEDTIRQVAYRQMATRMETLGRLYNLGQGDPPWHGPNGPATPVVLPQPGGDDLPGIIQRRPDASTAVVAFTDESVRTLPMSDLLEWPQAHISLRWIFQDYAGSVLDVLAGVSDSPEGAGRLVWIADAVVADAALVLAAIGIVRERVNPRVWTIPLVMAVGTVLVLAMVPGAPGNAARHRDTQSLPLLLVLIAGTLPVRWPGFAAFRSGVSSARTRPTSANAPAVSPSRSAR